LALSRIHVTTLRCLRDAELALDPALTYVLGPNGAGKTSLLEAIFLLGRGRSFRTRQLRRLVARGDSGFAVFGEIAENSRLRRVGVAWTAGHLDKRIDGESASGTAALAALFPVHVLDPTAHELIQGTPSERRRFLDWGVFHVEHGYLEAWRRYRRLLSQRNAALKAGAGASELGAWSVPLSEAGESVHELRRRYLARLVPAVERVGTALLGHTLTLGYSPGWDTSLPLIETLERQVGRDRQFGNTEAGPHRADLAVLLDSRPARDEASRGQQKLAAAGLVLAQARVHADEHETPGTLLVDDPAAELDSIALQKLLGELYDTRAQLVITGLTSTQLPVRAGFPVFHVERGGVSAL
jgi:DNA replication and repair protein RecF